MVNRDINIRILTTKDIEALCHIGRTTFLESFTVITPEADMLAYLDASFNEMQLLEELTDKNSVFYFIESGNDTIGYGKINFNKSPYGMEGMKDCMEIQRIYVLKDCQRNGLGHLLMDVFFEQTKQRHLNNIWLSTGSFNNKALNFYRKYGFEIVGHHEFIVGSMAYDDVILLRSEK